MLRTRALAVLLAAPFSVACGDAHPAAAPHAVASAAAPLASGEVAEADGGSAQPVLPALGKPCTAENKWTCLGERTVGACIDNVWTQSKCRGPNGCRPQGRADADCDENVGEEGESCLVATDVTCSPDRKRMLRCTQHVWRLAETCSGDLGCAVTARKAICDNSVAAPGDACLEEEDYACSHDSKSALLCAGGRFTLASTCNGPKHCTIDRQTETAKVQCDDSLATVGEVCAVEHHYSCAQDRRSILVCKSRAFAQDDRCKAKEACAVRGELVGCF